jgi:sialate O-acetylesterase
MKGFDIVYQLVIPRGCDYSKTVPEYTIDNSAETKQFTRVAYLLELQKAGCEMKYAFAAMDAFTDDVKQIAVPTAASGARFMQRVDNLTVRSNVDGIEVVTDCDGGNIEFWPGNYGPQNNQGILDASATLCDFGDAGLDQIPGYGCMQVHNWKAKQTVFAFNSWNNVIIDRRSNGTVDLGIGNSTASKRSRDWTFVQNGGTYTFRRLTVLVK